MVNDDSPAAPPAVQLPLDPANDTLELAHELLAAFRAHSYASLAFPVLLPNTQFL